MDTIEPGTKSPTKASIVAKLLSRPRGATLAEITEATSWQPHSARAFLTGLRKKGRPLAREQRRDGTSCYRFTRVGAEEPAPEPAGD